MAENADVKQGIIFPLGTKNDAYKDNFVGQSYLQMLVNDPDIDINIGNVTFAPACRNNWHIHHGYQVILVTGGQGWVQEEGQEAKLLVPGDVVVCHDGVKHWHGATKDSWFSHIAVTKGETEWFGEVENYDNLA